MRDCPKGYILAKTVTESIYSLENFEVYILSLDHDLGADEDADEDGNLLSTGYDLVKYICEYELFANRVGGD